MHIPHADEGTRERLLRAAAAILAEKGYEAATVRDICKRAGANIAAVNYHFGGKERLYATVLAHFEQRAQKMFPLDEGLPADPTPEERLRAFIRAMLRRMLADGDPIHAAHAKLLMLEILDPTPALDTIVETYMTPCFLVLRDIIHDFLGRDADQNLIHECIAAVISQCIFYFTHRSLIVRFYSDIMYDAPGVERIVESILRFSLRGICALKPCDGA